MWPHRLHQREERLKKKAMVVSRNDAEVSPGAHCPMQSLGTCAAFAEMCPVRAVPVFISVASGSAFLNQRGELGQASVASHLFSVHFYLGWGGFASSPSSPTVHPSQPSVLSSCVVLISQMR